MFIKVTGQLIPFIKALLVKPFDDQMGNVFAEKMEICWLTLKEDMLLFLPGCLEK